MSNSAIIISPDGLIYNGEHGSEDVIERKVSYEQKPVLGRYISSEPAKTVRDPQRQARYESLINDAMLGASMGSTLKNVKNSNPAAVTRMLKAAPEGVTNSENIELLQLIRLHPELQAMPETYFWLEAGFVTREIPHLEYKESFRDVVTGPQYIDRLQQIPATDLKYDQINYSLRKLADKVYVPFEDIWRTIINPMKADIENVRWAFQRKRNDSAFEAIKAIGNDKGTLAKFEDLTADSPYHSKGHAAKELMSVFTDFLKANDVAITHTFMSPVTFAEYTENTWTRTGPNQIMPERPTRGGIFPMPGLAGITAIVDPIIPNDKMYAINKPNALRLGEGPKVLRRYEDNERDAVAIRIVDFHQHLAVNAQLNKIDRKFGITLNLTEGSSVTV
jgi:hypothetical protein